LRGSHVHILGVAYKKDIDDMRESPALDVMHLLEKRGASVTFSDPYVDSLVLEGRTRKSDNSAQTLSAADCVVIITNHSNLDYADVIAKARLIVDTRNALKGFKSEKIYRL
jgi:UDP-N-acetyl-D-glucosamine dehydrogenase